MDCEQAVTLICAGLDGELRREDQLGLEEHLAACPACRATAEAFAIQDGELRRAFGPRRRAATLRALQVADRGVTRPRRPRQGTGRALVRLSAFAAGLAAAGVLYLVFNGQQQPRPKAAVTATTPAPLNAGVAQVPALGRLVPRPFVPAARPVELAAGETVETKAGERRRLAISKDGIIYLDQNTRFQSGGAEQGTLSSGRVCIAGAPMAVTTADRTIVLTGGRSEIRSDGKQSGLFVANGAAVVLPRDPNGKAAAVASGYELLPGAWQATPAPRATARLDWTRDLVAEGETPLVPASSYGGGALVAVDANGQEANLSLRKYHIDVHIEDDFARTTIDQTYFNHHPWRLEGTFYFPLPPDASLSRLAMYVDGNLMEGGMAEREHASRVYRQIVSSQRDPALLEWVDGSTFKMRVFPLEGRQEKRIILSYTQRLPQLYGKTTYRFPAGHSLQVVRDWSFHARVKGGSGLLWSSPTHLSIRGDSDGPDLLLTDAAANVKADRDVVLELDSGKQARPGGVARFVSAELDGRRYLMLRYRPTLAAPPAAVPTPRAWVFLCESSADRDPLLARAQIEVIRHMLTEAVPGDTFNILTAGTRTYAFATAPQPVTPQNITAAADFLGKTHLIGALDLGRAFDDAAKLVTGNNAWLVHLGSGYSAMGVRQQDLAKHLASGVRYVGIGVGKRWNRSFMKEWAERTSGHFTQINPDESLAWRALDVTATLNTPRLLGVTVEAPAGQPGPVFLTDGPTIGQGEELCAVARLAAENGTPLPMPRSLTVRGTLDGKPFSATLPVPEVLPDAAGYVPRTWAKLEIERLLAGDAGANRNRVVELSKAMYVMSPFTSLLVLENEAMYAQFKVDRGRKDHWAMYPCPPKVPVVYEPDPTQPVDVRNAPKGMKPQVNQVLQTVLVRERPSFQGRTLASLVGGSATGIQTSAELVDFGRLGTSLGRTTQPAVIGNIYLGEHAPSPGVVPQLTSGVFTPDGYINAFAPKNTIIGLQPTGTFTPEDTQRSGQPKDWAPVFDPITGRPLSQMDEGDPTILNSDNNLIGYFPPSLGLAVRGTSRIQTRPFPPIQIVYPNAAADAAKLMTRIPGEININGVWDREIFRALAGGDVKNLGDIDHLFDASIDLPRVEQAFRIAYERPTFSNDSRLFSDLLAYAPGFNTSPADVQAVLDAEAAPDLRAAPGHIEPRARQLIDLARSGGWQTVTFSGGMGRADLALTLDGAGRFAYEWVLPVGLREHVICDGDRLLHLYPDLGVGSRRSASRFHRVELAEMIPWLVPPADDLARGADVRFVDDDTVAIVSNAGKQTRALHLVFAAGRLAERRVVDPASGKVLARELFDGAGGIRWLDAAGKELGKRQYTVRPAKAPELKPDTSALVLLPLPFRSREHVFTKYRLKPERPLAHVSNGRYSSLDPDQVAELLAVALVTNNRADARTLFVDYFGPRDDHRRGLFTLMAACGVDYRSTPAFRKELIAHPDDPLLRYLFLQGNEVYQAMMSFLPARRGDSVDGNGFLHRLAVLHDLTLRWEARPVPGTNELVRRADAERTFAFVRQNADWPLTRALVTHVQTNLDGNLPWLVGQLADARGLLADRGGDYVDRYEQARLLFEAGRKDEAATCFLNLYAKGLKGGVLPRFDHSLRDALLAGDRWGRLMRQTAVDLAKENRRPAAITLAWQCREVGDAPLADSLLDLALDTVPGAERLAVTRYAVEYLRRAGAPRRADDLLRDLMAKEPYSSDARLWRLWSQVAEEMKQDDNTAVCLERALDLEYRDLPAVIDLQSWRSNYGTVLEGCRRLASAGKTLGVKPSPELLARVVRTADRWRSHDPESADACEKAADALADLGDPDLAWDYLTTATELRAPGQPAWRNLAAARRSIGDRETAERAYAAVCASEPENALLLWDRAQNLRSAGHTAEADALLRRLKDGPCPAEYEPVRERARWQLRGR